MVGILLTGDDEDEPLGAVRVQQRGNEAAMQVQQSGDEEWGPEASATRTRGTWSGTPVEAVDGGETSDGTDIEADAPQKAAQGRLLVYCQHNHLMDEIAGTPLEYLQSGEPDPIVHCDQCQRQSINKSCARIFHCAPCGYDICDSCGQQQVATKNLCAAELTHTAAAAQQLPGGRSIMVPSPEKDEGPKLNRKERRALKRKAEEAAAAATAAAERATAEEEEVLRRRTRASATQRCVIMDCTSSQQGYFICDECRAMLQCTGESTTKPGVERPSTKILWLDRRLKISKK